MSLEKAIGYLMGLGLKKQDALIYVYLAKKGPQSEEDLAYALNITSNGIRSGLKTLLTSRMIRAAPEHNFKFLAVPLEEVLDERVRAAHEQANALQASLAKPRKGLQKIAR